MQKEKLSVFNFSLSQKSNWVSISLMCWDLKRFEILFYWISSSLASMRQGVYMIETSRLGNFREMISTSTSLRWLAKTNTITIQRKSSRFVTISNKVHYSQIYLLDSNLIHIILSFQLSCMKIFKISHIMHVVNPTTGIKAYMYSKLFLTYFC
jgi:hypothetical protein